MIGEEQHASTCWREHEHVFSTRVSKLQDVLVSQLEIPPRWNLLTIQDRPICTLKVDHIRPDSALFVPKFILLFNVAELYHGVLFRAAGMLHGEIDNHLLAPDEPAAPFAELDRVENVGTFEDVHPPGVFGGRFSRFWRLVIFEDYRLATSRFDGVTFCSQSAGVGEIWLLFLGRGRSFRDGFCKGFVLRRERRLRSFRRRRAAT